MDSPVCEKKDLESPKAPTWIPIHPIHVWWIQTTASSGRSADFPFGLVNLEDNGLYGRPI